MAAGDQLLIFDTPTQLLFGASQAHLENLLDGDACVSAQIDNSSGNYPHLRVHFEITVGDTGPTVNTLLKIYHAKSMSISSADNNPGEGATGLSVSTEYTTDADVAEIEHACDLVGTFAIPAVTADLIYHFFVDIYNFGEKGAIALVNDTGDHLGDGTSDHDVYYERFLIQAQSA